MKIIFQCLLLSISMLSCAAFAADLEWSGLYRIEGDSLYKPDLTNSGRQLDYALQHLIMRPKIVASDGLTIRSQFDVFNSSAYPNTHLGQMWGNNPRGSNSPSSTTTADQSNVMSGNGAAGTIEVSQLYLTWDFEFGSLIAGRAPLQFGLGMTYSAGMGLFDHFYDSLDMIGYKLVYGNFFVLPMIGKSSSGAIDRNDDVDDYLIQAQYENPESNLQMGVIYHIRKAGDQGSDAPVLSADGTPILGDATATNQCSNCSVNIQTLNVFALKDTPHYRLGLEYGMVTGNSGVVLNGGAGSKVTIGSMGIASEFEYRPEESNWKYGLKSGLATGDDPNTTGKFEGFIFNRNYDVAFLLFNHPLGQFDVFRTRMIGGGGGIPTSQNPASKNEINAPDIDAISNVMYFAPYVTYRLGDRWEMKAVLATGYLNVDSIANQVGKGVGYELDYSINFKPRKGVEWINEVGALLPGKAFKGDGTYGDGFTYGVQSSAAISF